MEVTYQSFSQALADYADASPLPGAEFVSVLMDARDRHVKPVSSIMPGYASFSIDTDVGLLPWGRTMHEGVYYTLRPEGVVQPGKDEKYSWVWAAILDEDSVIEDIERAEAEGRTEEVEDEDGSKYTTIRGNSSFRMNMERLTLHDEVPLTYQDVLFWLSINDLLSADDGEGAARTFLTVYRPKNAEQEMTTLEAIAPEKHVVPNSKVTHVLRQGKSPCLFEPGGQPLKVDKKYTQIQLALWHDAEETEIEVSDEIDAEDVAVIEAVTTLKHAGNTVITPGQIIRNMGYKQPTPALVEEVHQRVLRLMHITGRIDWTEQAKVWNLKNPDTGEPYEHAEIIGNLLSMVVFDGTDIRGNRDIRYKVASDPITYEHARLVNQLIVYPPELLDLAPIDEDHNELKRVNREQKKLERAILWYVFSLKNKNNKMNTFVTYEALFDYEGVNPGSSSSRKRAIKFVHAYLRALQSAGVIYMFVPRVERSRRHLQTGVSIYVEKPGKGKKR